MELEQESKTTKLTTEYISCTKGR